MGGRHGQNQRGRDQHRGHHEHDGKNRRSGEQSVRNKDVKVTFINGTSQTMRFLQVGETTQHFIAPTARETFIGRAGNEAPKVKGQLVARNETRFTVEAFNPAIGLPGVRIWNETSGTKVFDERLYEREQIDSFAFLVTRLEDPGAYKHFEITPHEA